MLLLHINCDVFFISDYLQDGRPTSVQGPDLENQNSLDSGESYFYLYRVCLRKVGN